jgi:hypothetical protein
MSWNVYFHPKFKTEFDKLSVAVQDELLAMLIPLRKHGPILGRPEVDTLKDSKFTNMKELRFRAGGGVGAWRLCSTRNATRFCSLREINQVEVRRRFIVV